MERHERYQSPLREISNTPNRELKQGSHTKPSIEDQQRYTLLMKQARKAAEEGHPRESLQLLVKASKICRTEKVLKRIAKIEEYLRENGSESESEEDTGMCHVGKGFYLQTELYSKLYSYQREALMWFWRLHRKNKGGILGDDMGLGKTIQVISFLSGLFYLDQVKTVLIILPVALIINWEKEFDKWAPSILVESHHSSSKRERERALAKVQRRGGVLLTSYGLVLTNHDLLSHRHASPFTWDYVILDEGHKIKNPSKTTKAVHKVPATHRIILTGTPIQNNLKELWALFDFVTQGSLLGTSQTFNSEYANPITRAREKDATGGERLLGNQMAESLRELIAPYFLRRTKADVVKRRDEGLQSLEGRDTDADDEKSEERVPEFPTLTRKNDFVIWLHLTEAQIKIYRDFLSLDQVKELLMTTRSPLVELTILKKLCDHPRLLPVRACIQLGLETAQGAWADEDEDDPDQPTPRHQTGNAVIQAISDDVLMMESCKLQFLVNLLANLRQEGHRTLVFSQSRKMLDIIEKVLKNKDFEVMRLDGTITKLEDREKRISSFQHNDQLSVFLLTTQVGGVGLTLTGADRVVIFDPSWNPATDSQAVDRVYRIGQTRSVVIYRLITCGSVEEKIYRRQIFKDSLTKQATGTSKNPYRYFSRGELKDLFILDNPQTSTTQLALQEMHAAQRKTDTELDEHIAFLYSQDMFGLSDHDLMFSQEADTENREDQEQSAEYIQHRVSRAKELVSAESDLSQKLREQIDRDTEGPGSMQRHHRQYGDRQTLLEHAATLGEEVNVPAFNKRRDDYDRKNRSASESEEVEEEEEEEDLNMSMANMTLEEQRNDVPPQVAKGRPAVSLLADRPPSSLTAQGDGAICIEDSDEEEEENRSSMPPSRSGSKLAVIEDSDTEAMASPVAVTRVKSPRSSYGETSKVPRIKDEEGGFLADNEDGIIQDSHSEDDESSYSRQKRFATTPKEAVNKKNRMSNTPQGRGGSPGFHGNTSYVEEDSIVEVPATPASVIDLTDSDYAEGEAEISQFSFEEVEQRTVATSPLAAARGLSPDGSPRPISTATDVGELEKNVNSDYYMESDEGEEVMKTYSGLIPQSDHEASKTSSLSPDDRPESLLEGSYDSSIIEHRSVALSPMISHDDGTASEGSPANATDLNTSQNQRTRDGEVDGEFRQSGESAGESCTGTGKTFRYNSDGDSQGLYRSSGLQSSMDVTRNLSFDDTSIANRISEGLIVEEDFRRDTCQQDEVHEKDLKVSEEEEEGMFNQTDREADDEEERKTPSGLEHTMSFMSIGSGDENSKDDDQDNEDQDKDENLEEDTGQDDNQDVDQESCPDNRQESEDDAVVVPTRRRRVIEDSDEEESDEPVGEDEDPSPPLPSPSADEVNRLNPDQPQDEEDELDDHEDEERVQPGNDGDDSDEYEEEEEDEERVQPGNDGDDSDEYKEEEEDEERVQPGNDGDDSDEYEEEEEDEERVQPSNDHHDSDEYEGEEEEEYEDSFIDDEEYSEEEGSGSSEEEYEDSDQEEDEEAGGEEVNVSLTEEQQRKYQDLVTRGKLHESNKNVKKALACYLTALEIDDSDKELERRTFKLAQLYKKQKSVS